MKALFERIHKPWPSLSVLHIEDDEVSFEIFEERRLSSGRLHSLVSKLGRGVDILHVHSCDIPESSLSTLTPGGLVLVEGLDCVDEQSEFDTFVTKARRFGHVAIGRRIAVLVKKGAYRADPDRLAWPHKLSSQDL